MHLVWHRADLRTHDHAGLDAALRSGDPILPLVILDPHIFGRADLTPRRRAWFLENVRALRASYRALGGDLVVRTGPPAEVLAEMVRQHPAIRHVHLIRTYTPYAKARDAAAALVCRDLGVTLHEHEGQFTHPPGTVQKETGGRYGVYGPFARRWRSLPRPILAPTPSRLPPLPAGIEPGDIPVVQSDIPLPEPGETTALARLHRFIRDAEPEYATARRKPALPNGTSGLSMYFAIGVLSPRLAVAQSRTSKWLSELAWWDFNADILDRLPEGVSEEFRPDWRGFPWRRDDAQTERWRIGQTGFPLVDAGMRELQATGFMHNRVRMVTASFLTKQLMVDWRVGETIFRGLLLCGETAQNVGNWQWVAGSGVDAAPFFRILNPTAQGERCDPDGAYVRRWVPELAHLPNNLIHQPWLSGVRMNGHRYPAPMVDLAASRARFLATARAFLVRPEKFPET